VPARPPLRCRRASRVGRAGALAVALVLGACASTTLTGLDDPDFAATLRRYRGLEGAKALALATEANGRMAWGVRYGARGEPQAREGALEACRATARAGGMRAHCHLFAVGDEPDPDTMTGCLARRLPSRRCEMQRRFHGDLVKP